MAKKTTTKIQTLKEEPINLTAPAEQDEPTLPSAGLGDTIKSITTALGIKTCAGCERRRQQYNRLFPWMQAKEMPKLEGEDLEVMKRVNANPIVQNDDVNKVYAMYNHHFSPKRPVKRCQCPGLFRMMIERLNLLVNEEE